MFRFDKAFRQEFQSNWLPLATAFCCLLFGLSASAFSAPLLFPELISEFGWSRAEATLFASTKYVFVSLGAVVFGLVIDRVGVWFTLLFAMTLAGSAMVIWIWMSGLPVYYVSGAMSGFAIGGGGLALQVLIARSFHASQGTAFGLVLTGAALAGTLIPIIITLLISKLGWRYGYAAMSLSIWFIVIPLLVYGYFHSKTSRVASQAGQGAHDSSSAVALSGGQESIVARVGFYLRQKNFWIIAAAISISSLVDAGFTQHQVLILKDFGFSPSAVVAVISVIGLVNVAARVLSGNILDRTSNRGLAGLYVTLLLACAAAPFLPVTVMLIVFVLFRGFGHSAVMLDAAVMPKHAFGNTKNLGLLFGLMTILSNVGSASGPLLMGRIFDVSGSYNSAYALFAGLSLIAVFLALNIKPTYWLALNLKGEGSQGSVSTPSIGTNSRQG